jgi:AcrR family transcriptional regulator
MSKATSRISASAEGEVRVAEAAGSRGRGAGERILSAATDLFSQFGYNGVSTRDIASAAQVNEVTIFRHYSRKYDLYVAVLESELQQVHLRGDLLARIAQASDGQMALARTFDLVNATLLQQPRILRLLQYSALELSADFVCLVRRHLGELIEVIARYLDPWIEKGELRCTNAKTVILTIIGIVISRNSLQHVFLGEGFSVERMFEAYTGLVVVEPAKPEEPAVCQ